MEYLKYIVDNRQNDYVWSVPYGICLYCICRELEANLERVGSLSPYSWISRVSTHVTPRVQRTWPNHSNANMARVSVKTARSYTGSTRRVIDLGMHT